MVYYADSSALVKRYVTEMGSAWLQALCDPVQGHVIAFVNIGIVEIAAALAMKHRQGVLTTLIRDNLIYDLQYDCANQYWLIDVDLPLLLNGINLTRQHKLRGYDAVHLAGALFLQQTLQNQGVSPILLSADHELLWAAQAEGLLVDNPNQHP